MAELNETQTYFVNEHVEDYRDGLITRRELVSHTIDGTRKSGCT